MKLVADSLGRLKAVRLFKPGHVFDASAMPDGSIRIVELNEAPVPVAKVRFARDGTVKISPRPSRAAIREALIADRERRA